MGSRIVSKGNNRSPRELMLLKLKESGLDERDAKKLEFTPYSDSASASLNLSRVGEGFKIPYFSADGKKLKMFRYRYYLTEITNGFLKGTKQRKYDQVLNTPVEIYLPKLVDWEKTKANVAQPITITEGELKAACCTKYVMPCIGLGGVWNFGSKSRYQELVPALEHFQWSGRTVYICYDSDAVLKPEVMLAEFRLARRLTDLGAQVIVVRIPCDGDKKIGIDDYIVKHGKKATESLFNDSDAWGPSAALHEMNAEVVYCERPSSVIQHRSDSSPTNRIMGVTEFVREAFAHRRHDAPNASGTMVSKSTAKEWIDWPHRKNAYGVTVAPGAGPIVLESVNGTVVRKVNLWDGWGGTPIKGDVSPYLELKDHVFERADPAHAHWFEQWVAYPFQHPGVKLRNGVLIHGHQGVGKTLLGETIAKPYGRAGRVVDQRSLERDFNPVMEGAAFIVGDEVATRENRRDLAEHLKNLVTRPFVEINRKYINPYTTPNTAQFYLTSNHGDALYLENGDRRFFVHCVTAGKLSEEFSKKYEPWLAQQSSIDALLYHFMHEVDCTGFNPLAAPPVTEAKTAMVDASRSEHAAWIHELKLDPDSVRIQSISSFATTLSLHTVDELLRMFQGITGRCGRQAFALALKAEGFSLAYSKGSGVVKIDENTRLRLWAVRDVDLLTRMSHDRLVTTYKYEREKMSPVPALEVLQGGKRHRKRPF